MAEDRPPRKRIRRRPAGHPSSWTLADRMAYGEPGWQSPGLPPRELFAAYYDSRTETERHIDQAIAWLREKWGEGVECPYCHTAEWAVGTPVYIGLMSGEAMSPHFPVMCTNCGNTVLINAIRAGLVPEVEKDE